MNSSETQSLSWTTIFYLVFTILAFSSIEIIANPIRNDVAPMLITFWRFALGSLFLWPFLLVRKRKELQCLSLKQYLSLFFLGALNIIVSMGAHAVCMKYARASTAAILIAANPIATNFFSWLIAREEMPVRRVTALLMGLVGIVMLALRPDSAVDTPVGIAAGIVGMTGFGLYTVLSKKMVQQHGSILVTTISSSSALLAYIPLLLLSGHGIMPTMDAWPRLALLGVIGSGLGYVTFFKALEAMPAGRASYLFFFKPPVAIVLAWLILGEEPGMVAILGTVMIMSGILVENLRKK
ncbi:MAG: DMT family transporter [Candidatus Rifleibacteriota bacterium]